MATDEVSEQAEKTAQTADAETITGAAGKEASLKKFKNAQELLKAYENLEAEFTKKCQKLSQFEAKASGTSGGENAQAPLKLPVDLTEIGSDSFIEEHILTNKAVIDRVISEYLKGLCKTKAPKTIFFESGVTALTPPAKPRSIAEAGLMAQKMLKNI